MLTLRYVFSETGIGLRRHVSMSVALIVTIFISLTLVGMGLLLNAQAHKAEQSWGNKLQITVFLCNKIAASPNCDKQEATDAQKQAVLASLKANPDVASFYTQSKQEAYQTYKRIYVRDSKADQQIYSTVTPADMEESVWVTLKDPRNFAPVEQSVAGLPGVDKVRDLHQVLKPVYFWITALRNAAIGVAAFLLIAAILQVGNTIRLAAFARRREIGIMRLVGASSLYISLPFLMETLVAAVVGIALAGGTLALFTWLVVYDKLRGSSHITEWIDWGDTATSFGGIAVLGVLLTLIPTLVLTRKYLNV
ncbi:MAG: permease-like cell division protein FtsX [Marmoricola sp.]